MEKKMENENSMGSLSSIVFIHSNYLSLYYPYGSKAYRQIPLTFNGFCWVSFVVFFSMTRIVLPIMLFLPSMEQQPQMERKKTPV